jgi:CRP/FNR family transcriptional regulator
MANTLLGTLPAEVLQELHSIMSIESYDAGGILFLEQEMLNRVFIILDGEVRLSLQDVGGRRLTLQIGKRGAVLGLHSKLFGGLTEWSADALYPSRIAVITKDDLLGLAQRHPELYRIAAADLVITLGHACTTLRIVGLTSCVRKRLASQLLAWGERGHRTGDRTQFCMALTHAQIAECIGAVRETVTRALTNFKLRGLVEIRGCMLTIPSTTALKRYVDRG